MRLSIRKMRSRNVWPLPSGELAVRPGLRKVYAAESGRKIVGGFSVRNFATEEVFHYVVDVATSGTLDCKIRIYDENYEVFQVYDTNADVEPRTVTHAIIKDQIMIASPDFPTVWGLVGGGLFRAKLVASDNPSTTAIDVPRGIVTSWASRAVMAFGNSLYISDPVDITGGSPQTFIALNQWPFEAAIYGLHSTPGGRLVACTTRGVFALDSSAAAAGQVPTPDWYQISDYLCLDYEQTAMVHGRVYGMTRKGFRLVDDVGTKEAILDDPYMPIVMGQRITSDDYRRSCRILSTDLGPIVSYDEIEAFYRVDLATRTASWWTMTHTSEEAHVRGTLLTRLGDEILLTEDGGYRVGGNFDGDEALSENATAVRGGFYMPIPFPPDKSVTIREVTFATDGIGDMFAAVRGDPQTTTKTAAAQRLPVSTDASLFLGIRIGAVAWNNAATLYSDSPLRSYRFEFAVNTDDPTVEISAENPFTRFSDLVDLVTDGVNENRPEDP